MVTRLGPPGAVETTVDQPLRLHSDRVESLLPVTVIILYWTLA